MKNISDTLIKMNLFRLFLVSAFRILYVTIFLTSIITAGSQQQKTQQYNHLIHEKSPYLLHHATNPVNWYPWGDEAFAEARKYNKPIFLSIGYSSCHWCHVMEQESFEDPAVAKMMNESFVPVLVDREERPDLDEIYMKVCELLTGEGGWPLNIIMTPDLKPFFAGTYIPKENWSERQGMISLLPKIDRTWKAERQKVVFSANEIAGMLQSNPDTRSEKEVGKADLEAASSELSGQFDSHYGGFGKAPKFPSAHDYFFLLRQWKRTGNQQLLTMVEKSLHAMRAGGIYDHLGFGFHRYSTDQRWKVPHFEKMLYDQAMMALLYTEAYQATKKNEYARTVREILSYVLRDMTSSEGGFFSAEDADSEGQEGKFYFRTQAEIENALGEQDSKWFIRMFHVEKGGNFEEQSARRKTGLNILYLDPESANPASEFKLSEIDFETRFQTARQKLLEIRNRRPHPAKDDKILADWNGLMIVALARAGQVLDDHTYIDAARRTADFLEKNFTQPDGRLWHRFRNGEAAVTGFLDDYAFFTWGLIELYEADFNPHHLKLATKLNQYLLTHFWDNHDGGFFLTSNEGESLLIRPKRGYDSTIPSGNSIAMLNLLRLGRITANSDYEIKAATVAAAFSKMIKEAPAGFTQMLCAVDFLLGPSYEVIIAGDSKASDTQALLRALRSRFIPNKIVLFRPIDEQSAQILEIADFMKYYSTQKGKAAAYVCLNYKCQLPTTDPQKMLALLSAPL